MSFPFQRRRRFPWIPWTLVILATIAILVVRSQSELERNFKAWLTAAIPLLTAGLLLLWFLCTPRYRWRTKAGGVLLLGVLALGGRFLLRVDGTTDGTGLPRLVWRWNARTAGPLPQVEAGQQAALPADPRLAQARDVPRFFGEDGTGVYSGAGLARDWTATPPKELWRQPIGAGWSSWAVVGGRAFTQEQRGEEEMVTCYDLFTGHLLWSHADPAHFSQWQGGDGPRATPTVVDGRVYTYGATGILNCLDATSGQRLWTRNILSGDGQSNIEWGTSSSPLVTESLVIVTGGKGSGPVLLASDRATGAPVWAAGDDDASYSSPVLVTLAGRSVILSLNAKALTAHDPATGAVLLTHPFGDSKWPKAAQPMVAGGDRVFLSAGYGVGCELIQVSAAPDGNLSASEIWRGLKMKNQFNTAAIRGGHLYGLDDGRLACVDLATGDRVWKDGRFGSGQSVLVDDLVIIQSEQGPVHLAAAVTDGYTGLGKIDALTSKTWNFPVLAGRYLLVRNDREAVCYELPVSGG